MNSNKQNLINKIIYRSQYRGTKEMDIFVSGFVKSIIDSLSFDDLDQLTDGREDSDVLKEAINANKEKSEGEENQSEAKEERKEKPAFAIPKFPLVSNSSTYS